MKNRIRCLLGLGIMSLGLGVFAQQPNDEVLKKLQQLQDQINKQQAEIEQLKVKLAQQSVTKEQVDKIVEESVKKATPSLTLGKGIDGLRITGDLRERYEARSVNYNHNSPESDGDLTRLRSRFRLGGVWTNKAEDWEVGAGVATGNDKNGRSTNADWGRGGSFDHMELWLDYAYAKHKWLMGDTPVALTLGQQKSPYITSLLNWDTDLRPTGVTVQYADPTSKDYSGPFATAGMYMLSYRSSGSWVAGVNYTDTNHNDHQDAGEPTIMEPQDGWDDDVWLYWVQAGFKLKTGSWDSLAAVGFQAIPNTYRNAAVLYPAGGTNNPNNAYPGDDTGYNYYISDLYLETKTMAGGFEFKPYAHLAYNFGADGNKTQAVGTGLNNSTDPSDENMGWLLGLDVSRDKWKFGYAYGYVGADCVFGPLRDADFGSTAGLSDTDVQGHILKVNYAVTKNVDVGASAMLVERINADTDNNSGVADSAGLYQCEVNYRF